MLGECKLPLSRNGCIQAWNLGCFATSSVYSGIAFHNTSSLEGFIGPYMGRQKQGVSTFCEVLTPLDEQGPL
jgi:hypothetical protein